jgi:hypothetical protein
MKLTPEVYFFPQMKLDADVYPKLFRMQVDKRKRKRDGGNDGDESDQEYVAMPNLLNFTDGFVKKSHALYELMQVMKAHGDLTH